jgi:DNA-binding MarR family transcriptional regulator
MKTRRRAKSEPLDCFRLLAWLALTGEVKSDEVEFEIGRLLNLDEQAVRRLIAQEFFVERIDRYLRQDSGRTYRISATAKGAKWVKREASERNLALEALAGVSQSPYGMGESASEGVSCGAAANGSRLGADAEFQQLQAELERLRIERTEERAQLGAAHAKIERLEADLATAEDLLTESGIKSGDSPEPEQLRSDVKQLVQDYQLEVEGLRHNLVGALEQVERLRRELEASQEQVRRLESEVGELKQSATETQQSPDAKARVSKATVLFDDPSVEAKSDKVAVGLSQQERTVLTFLCQNGSISDPTGWAQDELSIEVGLPESESSRAARSLRHKGLLGTRSLKKQPRRITFIEVTELGKEAFAAFKAD